MRSPHLRVTARCLREDLGLDASSYAGRDARYYCAEHEILRVFVTKREGAPAVGEQVKGIEPFGRYISLHHGRWRGLTVWDPAHDVCWLVAFSETHAAHEDRDAYNYFMQLGGDKLLPTADDYELLEEVSTENLIDGLADRSAGIYEEARANPSIEFNETYEGGSALVLIDMMVIDDGTWEEGWIAITFPRDTPLNEYTALDLVSKILPKTIVADTLELSPKFGSRLARHDELVFSWTYAHG